MHTTSQDVGFLEVAGPDARSFLQNLSTNDLRPLAPGQGCELFFTTHKAKIVGHAVATCVRDDAFLLASADDRAAAIFKHLDRHLISERVELNSLDSTWSLLRILGPQALQTTEALTGTPLGALKLWEGVTLDGSSGAFVRRQGAYTDLGFDLIGPAAWVGEQQNALASRGCERLDDAALEVMRIEAGWPKWGHEMDENRFVVELGRTAAAISYAKGCYLGQEPIVMARDRGQVNRQLMGFHCPGAVPPPPGTKAMLGEVEQFKVTSAAFSAAANGIVGLAFVYRGQQTPGATIPLAWDGVATQATLAALPTILPRVL